jgi:chromosome segregation protein
MTDATCINKMYLKGFKSFQRQTAIPFYRGLTAIVGRNGSGKSNIIDGLSFVLGERSSQLRAKKLEQLIFNGGDSRKPADEAVVKLTLDNSDGAFDEFLDEDQDEIEIGRKITRNGYSTYRFEGSNCKWSQIEDVLEKAGIDPRGYHFVRQGKITDIVNQTPVERRKIIDEISGIASYEKKKEKAEEELEEVQERINEFEIKQEMKKDHLDELKQQKEAAEEYKELEERKKKLAFSILKMREEALQGQMDELGESEKEDRIDELEDAVEELDDHLEELEEEKDEIEEEMEEGQDASIVQEIERIKGKIQRKKNDIETKREKIDTIESLLNQYQSMSGYQGRDKAVKSVLQMDKDGVHGTLGQLLHYDNRFGVAIETALGAKFKNIVVDSRQIAVECVNYLKNNNIGRATFLPMDKVSPRSKSSGARRAVKKPGAIDFAVDLVDYDQTYETVVKYALGDTIVAENLDALKDAGRVRAVTLDGDIMRKGGSITGGKKKRSRSKRKSSSKKNINPEKKRKKKKQLEKEIDELKDDIGTLNSMLEEKKQEQEERSQVSEELKERKEQVKEELSKVREKRREKAEELNKLQSQIGDVQKKRAKFEAELANVRDDLEQERFDDLDDDDVEEDDISNLKRKRTMTINKMNDLGNVNMKAIEEYEEFKEEYEAFKEKFDEIKEEKDEIEALIQEIEARKREQFMEALEGVSAEFNELFTELFEGGEAGLELEDEDDIESGLVIRASPPDKDPTVLDSLSGGEKTLTAIAFVFAIQEYQPSPFYVMDEIDASLDSANCEQLSDLLGDYAEESQLVFISHNEETVRHADRAYGVSMRDGVSKVRSIELS